MYKELFERKGCKSAIEKLNIEYVGTLQQIESSRQNFFRDTKYCETAQHVRCAKTSERKFEGGLDNAHLKLTTLGRKKNKINCSHEKHTSSRKDLILYKQVQQFKQ